MRRRGILLAALFAIAASVGNARAATAKGPGVEVTVIQAVRSDGGGSVDPGLADLPTKRKPFVDFNVFKLLDRKQLSLEKPLSYPLVDGRTLQVTLAGTTDEKGEKRYQLQVQIAEAGKGAFLKNLQVTASANEPFFVGGQSYQGGKLFVELVLRP